MYHIKSGHHTQRDFKQLKMTIVKVQPSRWLGWGPATGNRHLRSDVWVCLWCRTYFPRADDRYSKSTEKTTRHRTQLLSHLFLQQPLSLPPRAAKALKPVHTDQTCAVSTPFRPAVCAGTTTPRGPGDAVKDSDTAAAPRMQQPQTSVSRQSGGGG